MLLKNSFILKIEHSAPTRVAHTAKLPARSSFRHAVWEELHSPACAKQRKSLRQPPRSGDKSQVGTGHSVRDQINEVLAKCELAAIDGSNDRIGGRQLMFPIAGPWAVADCGHLPATNCCHPEPHT
jgi:hypothetical protein